MCARIHPLFTCIYILNYYLYFGGRLRQICNSIPNFLFFSFKVSWTRGGVATGSRGEAAWAATRIGGQPVRVEASDVVHFPNLW